MGILQDMSDLVGDPPGTHVLECEMTCFRRREWYVAPAPLADAQRLVRQYHYSKGGSNTAVYVHGLYERTSRTLYGVAWWLPPTRVACESVNKENWTKVLALTRLVIHPEVPRNACSFLISRSVDLIQADRRFLSLVTYADESQGHTGGIYRAANWDYVGRTGPYPRWVDKDGRQVATKATVSRTKAQMEALGHVRTGSYHKHKFVKHLKFGPMGIEEPLANARASSPSGR